MDMSNLHSNWSDFASSDAELDKAITSILQGSTDVSPSAALPSWCHAVPYSAQDSSDLASSMDHGTGFGTPGLQALQTGQPKLPVFWSMGDPAGTPAYIHAPTLCPAADMSTPINAQSLKGDMGRLLGHVSTPIVPGSDDVRLEDIMDLEDIAKDSATPQLSPTSIATMSPLDIVFQGNLPQVSRDPVSQYHNTVAADHARHLTGLVDPDNLGTMGHSDASALASSLSQAIFNGPFSSRPRRNTASGLTIQQRRRMTLLAKRASDKVAGRKRQLSAPGSCLPGITTSPELEKVKLQKASPHITASSIDAATPAIPDANDQQESWHDIVLANSHDLVFVLSLKGTVLYISPSVERILGYLQEEIVGRALIDFCHPADVGPLSRELKESTTVLAGVDSQECGDDVRAAPAPPKINLIMRMLVKGGGYNLIEATGNLSVDPPKHRKVVVCSGRPHPVPMLPWEHVRGDLLDPEPSAWLKLSHNGIFLGCTGPINKILGIEDVSLVGRHIRDLPMVASSSELLEALRSGRTISVQDWVEGSAKQRLPVKLTVYPWTSDGRSNNAAFVHVQQRLAQADDGSGFGQKRTAEGTFVPACDGAGGLTGSMAMADGGTTRFMSQVDAASTVFAELTAYHGGSWLVEMQKLQNANKRLRHELQALTKRSAVHGHSNVRTSA